MATKCPVEVTGIEFFVRDAVPSDALGIAEVHTTTWKTSYRGILPDTLLDSLSVARRTERWANMSCLSSDDEAVHLCRRDHGRADCGIRFGGTPRIGDWIRGWRSSV